MYYRELFTPILSYAAHARMANADPRTTAVTVLRMAAAALADGRENRPAHLDAAWFPVCVWLDEQLATVWKAVGTDAPLRRRYFHGDRAGWEFFARLDSLLARGVEQGPRREIAFLYHACLQLGYQGGASRDQRRDAMAHCTRDLEARYHPAAPLSRSPRKRLPSLPARVALWAVPLTVTIALYGMYRYLLAEWFARIAGA